MKYLFTSLIAMFTLASCRKEEKTGANRIEVSVILDITDIHQLHPDAESIIPLFQLNKDENNETVFRISPLTDRELNPYKEFRLKDGLTTEKDNKEDDQNLRKKLIIEFYNSVRKSIDEENRIAAKDTPLHYSECYKTISQELQRVYKARADTTILMIFSDLRENSSMFNVYDEKDKVLLEKHPEQLLKMFEQNTHIPESLKSITIIFVYNPTTREDDRAYMSTVNLYKQLLEPRGATVIVQANNQNFTL